MNVAIIPARGGSKRIPRKNIKLFSHKPIIAWSIETAIKSNCFDHIIVSTDDNEIAEIARQYGATTPFIRPQHLANDLSPTIPVIAHAIEQIESSSDKIDLACCIYPTAPFLLSDDLQQAQAQLITTKTDYCFSATSFAFPIQRAFRLSKTQRCDMFHAESFNQRSQDLEPAYHDAGQFYWGTREAWLHQKPFFEPHSSAYLLPRYRVQDIDTLEDWQQAEFMFKVLQQKAS